MTPMTGDLMLAASDSLAVSIAAKVTIVLALGLTAARLGRLSRAAVRHALLAATFGVTLLLPIAAVLMPPFRLRVPAAPETRAAMVPLVSGAGASPGVITVGADPGGITRGRRGSPVSLGDLLLGVWAAGAALFLLPVMVGLWQIRALRRSGLPWRHAPPLVERLARDAGIRRPVEVALHESLPGPMTCGVIRPAILLPRDAQHWSAEDLNRAILHELEHIRRFDSISCGVARAVCAAYWFHPLIWMAWRKLALEAERSCDDAVLKYSEATVYADQLVGLAARLSGGQKPPLMAMASRADLATRVDAVLDQRQRRGRAGIVPVSMACAAAAALVFAVSPLALVSAPQAIPETRPFEVASVRVCTANSGGRRGDTKQAEGNGFSGGLDASDSPGRLNTGCAVLALHFPMAGLIQRAYGGLGLGRPVALGSALPVEGGPSWIYSEGYIIQATAPQASIEAMEGPMLRTLLEDRFRLKLHRETKQVPVYALTIGKGGFKLPKATPGSCTPPDFSTYPMPALPAGKHYCNNTGVGGRKGPNTVLNQDEATVDDIAKLLTLILDRPVVDKTGLTGQYNFHLEFAVDQTTPGVLNAPSFGPVSDAAPAASIFTVVQEQLGLKLEPARGARDVLVIDHVERPSEN